MPLPDTRLATDHMPHSAIQLGLRANLAQFVLLASITFGVGLVVGAERVVVPVLARQDFAVASFVATLAFIVSFGFVKAALNLIAGRLADQYGRKRLLIVGWLVAFPIPFLIIFAPSWGWIVAANLLLGVNQGLAWTMTVTSKIDLVGPRNRGFALGINEFSGYAGVSVGGFLSGLLGGIYGLRVAPFLFVLAVILVMTVASLLVHETLPYAHLETQARRPTLEQGESAPSHPRPRLAAIFALTTWGDRSLAAASQAGLIEKFTDTLAWGLFPLYFASHGLSPVSIGAVVGTYTGTWAILQIYTGHLTDRIGRKWPIVGGMWLAALGIALVAAGSALLWWLIGALLMGVGMALLYPTLLAVVSDVAAPQWRATSLGVYRLWRDSGYAFGALAIGVVADVFGLLTSFWFAATLMAVSGLIVALLMYETLPTRRTVHPVWEQDARLE
ncbi:MAG TPA: MFS transporter [Ktedonobacteraceae bacterium]|nr:MFS transporter [Ktedonobacteraceae bacterium]